MTDRQVKVTLSAQVNGYIDGLTQAARKTREFGTEAEKLSQQTQAFQLLGRTGLAMGVALAAGLGVAIVKASEFDQAMSYVAAATHESAENMDLLRKAALDAGARTVYSATEAANAVEELGKAGVDTKDILSGGLNGALDLAAAGGIGVAQAAGIAATALKTFKLEGTDMAHVSDLLAAGAGKAMGGVGDLGAALDNVGLQAANSGLSIEETTGFLAAFASYGKIGGDAGTAFKSMLQALAAPSAEASAKMQELGINAYDASGNFVGLAALAGNLRTSMIDLTPAQRDAANAIIFGSYGVQAATALYNEGADGIRGWTDAVNDQGYAAETAALRLDNLSGDVEKLSGAIDTGLISSGTAANDTLRFLTQAATDAVDGFNDLPEPLQGAALALVAVAAAATLGSGAFLTAVPKIAEYRKALDEMTPGVQRAARVIGVLSKAAAGLAVLSVAGALISEFSDKISAEFLTSADELTNSLKTGTSAAEAFRAALGTQFPNVSMKAANEQVRGLNDALLDGRRHWHDWNKDVATSTDVIFDSLDTIGNSLGELAATDLPAAQQAFNNLADETDRSKGQLWALLAQMPAYKDALTDQANALGINVTSTDEAANKQALLKLAMGNTIPVTQDAASVAKDAASAYMETADKVSDLDDELAKLIDSINEANGVGQDAVSANIDYQNALAELDEEIQNARDGVEGYSLGLDQSTQVGRDHMEMLVGLADNYQSAAEKQFALDGNTENYIANLQAGREAVLQRARDLGATDEQIQFLSDHIVQMPSEKEIKIIADTAAATEQLDAWIRTASGKSVQIQVGSAGYIYSASGGANEDGGFYSRGVRAFESGGFPSGMYLGRPGGIHKFAEETLPWETYISPKPGHEQENIGYALEALARLGFGGGAQGSSGTAQPVSSTTWAPVFQLAPQAGRSVSDQAFEAARRLRIRRK